MTVGDPANAVAVSDQATAVGLRGAGGGDGDDGGVRARGRPPRTAAALATYPGLNRNHNHVVKDLFKGAATATARAGAFQDFYRALVARGMREELARVSLTRKLAALTLRLWKTGERYDPAKLTIPAVPAR